jgi:DnaK suppressor protein
VDEDRVRELLTKERAEVEQALAGVVGAAQDDREAVLETGDSADPAPGLEAGAVDDATAAALRDRLEAITRAEARLAAGQYGTSIQSGAVIPDERLEADPAAEPTVEEADAAGR